MRLRTAWALYGVSLAAALGLTVAAAVWLPETVPSRFGASGEPTQTLRKDGFLVLWLLTLVMANLWAFLMPLIVRSAPATFNLPNKAFWMATPERRAFVADEAARLGLWCFALTNALLTYVLWGTISVALGWRTSVGFWLPLAAYLAVLAGLVVRNYRTFKRTDARERLEAAAPRTPA